VSRTASVVVTASLAEILAGPRPASYGQDVSIIHSAPTVPVQQEGDLVPRSEFRRELSVLARPDQAWKTLTDVPLIISWVTIDDDAEELAPLDELLGTGVLPKLR
jgi:hypothetical protein